MDSSIKLSHPATREFWEIPILFEDEDLLALDKPAGLPLSPDPADPTRPNLITLLHQAIQEGKPWVTERGLGYLMNADRLDPEMSGVLLLAKAKTILTALGDLFGSEKPWRKFVTLVQGGPDEETFEVGARLAPNPVRAGRIQVDHKHGKRSRTRFKVIERFAGWTLLECEPLGLRPHQIRVHLSYIRLPVAGDSFYDGKPLLLSTFKSAYRLKPQASERPLISFPIMHAAELTFPQPQTNQLLTLAAPWPKDLLVAVKYLRRYASGAAAPVLS